MLTHAPHWMHLSQLTFISFDKDSILTPWSFKYFIPSSIFFLSPISSRTIIPSESGVILAFSMLNSRSYSFISLYTIGLSMRSFGKLITIFLDVILLFLLYRALV